jgi:hypothetical protein
MGTLKGLGYGLLAGSLLGGVIGVMPLAVSMLRENWNEKQKKISDILRRFRLYDVREHIITKAVPKAGHFAATYGSPAKASGGGRVKVSVLGAGEMHTSKGRSDPPVCRRGAARVIEIKVAYDNDGKAKAQEAIEQITARQYADPFKTAKKAGIAIDGKTRRINDWVAG